jgi:4-diphosphocytidyl-2-C-methyl-D-erythritol kinase
MSSFKIKSYAKINLALNVIGKKTKLHKIESIISFIELHDLIILEQINQNNHKVVFKGKFSKDIGKINTVTSLLKLLDKKNLLNNQKFKIEIVKNIPQEAGMGGGSMNASSLINFFIKKKILKIKNNELTKLVSQIGSDVILGIKPSNTILSHNGNIKRYNKSVKFYTLVVKPNFGCSTKYIYSKVKIFSKPQFNSPQSKMFDAKYLKTLSNDLENIAFKKYPKLKKIKLFLSNTPRNMFTRMSGSGSSIVAYFDSKRACVNANSQFQRKFGSHWCIVSKTI